MSNDWDIIITNKNRLFSLYQSFQDCLGKCSDPYDANQSIWRKVYFQRLAIPLSIVISNLIKTTIQLFLFLVVYINYFASGIVFHINAAHLLIPLLIIEMDIVIFNRVQRNFMDVI